MYTVLAQRNVPGLPAVPWAGQRLGTCNGVTIGSDGCYVTAMAQVASHYEHLINPAQLDDILTARGFYAQGCLMLDQNLQRVFPDLIYRGTVNWPNAADLNWLVMRDDEEIIVGLDNLNQGARARHFARVFDYNPATGVVKIDDPWWGATIDFRSRYGDPRRNLIKGVRYQKPGWIPPWRRTAPVAPTPAPVPAPAPAPPIIVTTPDLAAQVATLTAEKAELTAKLAQSATAVDALTTKLNADEAAIAFAVQSLQQRKGA